MKQWNFVYLPNPIDIAKFYLQDGPIAVTEALSQPERESLNCFAADPKNKAKFDETKCRGSFYDLAYEKGSGDNAGMVFSVNNPDCASVLNSGLANCGLAKGVHSTGKYTGKIITSAGGALFSTMADSSTGSDKSGKNKATRRGGRKSRAKNRRRRGASQKSPAQQAAASKPNSFLAKLAGQGNLDEGGFTLDILKPSEAINLVLGKTATLFSVWAPRVDTGWLRITIIEYTWGIGPIGIYLKLFAQFRLEANLGAGFDTYGINKFKTSKNALDIFDGIFIAKYDRNFGPSATMPDMVVIGGGLGIAGGLNAGILKAEIYGTINFELAFQLNEIEKDNKVRISEMYALAKMAPNPAAAILAIVSTEFRLYLTVGFFVELFLLFTSITLYHKEWQFPLLTVKGNSVDGFQTSGIIVSGSKKLNYNKLGSVIDNKLGKVCRIQIDGTGSDGVGSHDVAITAEQSCGGTPKADRYTENFVGLTSGNLKIPDGYPIELKSSMTMPMELSPEPSRRRNRKAIDGKLGLVTIDLSADAISAAFGVLSYDKTEKKLHLKGFGYEGSGLVLDISRKWDGLHITGTKYNDELVFDGVDLIDSDDGCADDPTECKLQISLGEGDDTVVIRNAARNFKLDLGSGSDKVTVLHREEKGVASDGVLSNKAFMTDNPTAHIDLGSNSTTENDIVVVDGRAVRVPDQVTISTSHGTKIALLGKPSSNRPRCPELLTQLVNLDDLSGYMEFDGVETLTVLTGPKDDTLGLCDELPESVGLVELKTGLGSNNAYIERLEEIRKKQHRSSKGEQVPFTLLLEGRPEGLGKATGAGAVKALQDTLNQTRTSDAYGTNTITFIEDRRKSSVVYVVLRTNGFEYNYASLDASSQYQLINRPDPVACPIDRTTFIDTAEECLAAAEKLLDKLSAEWGSMDLSGSELSRSINAFKDNPNLCDPTDKRRGFTGGDECYTRPYGCFWSQSTADFDNRNDATPQLEFNPHGSTSAWVDQSFTRLASICKDPPLAVFTGRATSCAQPHSALYSVSTQVGNISCILGHDFCVT